MAIDTPGTATYEAPAADAPPLARSRRALLTAALGGLGGLFASRLGAPDPAVAAAGDPLLIGDTGNNAGTANTTLTTSSTGTALLITQNGSGTALRGSAVGPGSIAGFFTAANGTGISGVTGNPNAYGAYVANDAVAGTGGAIRAAGKSNNGVVATTDSATKYGIVATNSAPGGTAGRFVATGGGWGVYGQSTDGSGVRGNSSTSDGVTGTSDNGFGVYGFSDENDAGHFDGNLYAGSVTGGIKAFRIDHPVDPAGKVLVHSCVESNERLTVYAGTTTTDANGEATIELPSYFDALNGGFRYQLTVVGAFAQAIVKHKIAGNRFTIATSEPGTEVCWQVTGVRQDAYAKAHPLVVEAAKTGKEKGRYLNPVEHGQPESKGVTYERRARARAQVDQAPPA